MVIFRALLLRIRHANRDDSIIFDKTEVVEKYRRAYMWANFVHEIPYECTLGAWIFSYAGDFSYYRADNKVFCTREDFDRLSSCVSLSSEEKDWMTAHEKDLEDGQCYRYHCNPHRRHDSYPSRAVFITHPSKK